MYIDNVLSYWNLESFNFKKTKKKVKYFFARLEKLQWEWAKLCAQKHLTANYDFATEYKNEPYDPMGKDMFNLSIKEFKEDQIKQYITNYYWAKNSLCNIEQTYIDESFMKHKYEDEITQMLGFYSADSREFKKLKKSAIYKFADFLGLLIEK